MTSPRWTLKWIGVLVKIWTCFKALSYFLGNHYGHPEAGPIFEWVFFENLGDVNGIKDMTALKLEMSDKQQLIKIRLS